MVVPINRVYADYAPLDYPRLARWIADHGNPFLPDGGLVSVVEPHQRAAMLDGPPAIIVTSAPDCRSGPSRHYASALAGNRKHLILVPAGRAAKQVVAQAVAPRTVNCGIGSYGLTAHANGEALAALAARWRPSLVVINHGQPEVKAALQARLIANGLQAVVAAASRSICWPAAAT